MSPVVAQTIRALMILGQLLVGTSHSLAETGEWFPGQIPWGKTREEIQRSAQQELAIVSSGKEALAFRTKVLGEEAVIEYTFARDRLTRVRCVFAKYAGHRRDLPQADDGQWLRDYLKIRKRLTKRIGQPHEIGSATSRQEAKALEVLSEVKDPKRLGFMEEVIRRGAALWYTSWRTDDTWTTLLLTGGQGLMRMEIHCFAAHKEEDGNQTRPSAEE